MQSILKFHARTNTTTESQASIKYILIIYLIALKNVFKKNIKQHNKKKVIIMVLKKNGNKCRYYTAMTKLKWAIVCVRSQLAPPTHSLLIWTELKEEVMWPPASVEMAKWRTEQMENKSTGSRRNWALEEKKTKTR